MTRFKNIISVAIVTLIFFVSSCKIHDLDFNGIENFSVGSLQSENIEFTINVKIDNPNSFKIKVIKANLQLFIGGNAAGDAFLADKITIQKRKEDVYAITITTDKKKIMSAVVKAAIPSLVSGQVNVEVKGWIKGRVFGIGKKIDVSFKEKVPVDTFKKLKN